MKVALFGYGAMGRLVEAHARAAGDEIGVTFTSKNSSSAEEMAQMIGGHDVAIDFSAGSVVVSHTNACMQAGVPMVQGTTGWKNEEQEVRRVVAAHDGALVFGANFSVGVNVFYRIIEEAARLFADLDQYDSFIEERHHSRKLDAPSGTALKLKNLMIEAGKAPRCVTSTRAGYIPGTHLVGFDSAADQVTLTHMARSRDGFAAGAMLAAHWIIGRKGIFEFSEVIAEVISDK